MGEATQHALAGNGLPLPALKILTYQLPEFTYADRKFRTVDGLEFQRAWVQGHVVRVSPEEYTFDVSDGTGQITVYGRDATSEELHGQYLLVVGKLAMKKSSRKDAGRSEEDPDGSKAASRRWQLAAQKVKPLSGGSRREELWRREVQYLHRTVYSRIAEQHANGG